LDLFAATSSSPRMSTSSLSPPGSDAADLNASQLALDAADLNLVTTFLCQQEIPEISPFHLVNHCGIERADLLILIGNSLLHTAAAAANGWKSGAVNALMVAGGVGHSTPDLRQRMQSETPLKAITGLPLEGIPVNGRTEAEILASVLVRTFGVNGDAILLETKSTNCGANAIESRRVLENNAMVPSTIVIVQDPLMQRRTIAAFKHVWRDRPSVTFISAPPFIPVLEVRSGRLTVAHPDENDVWDLPRYLELVMGEIPRLRDDSHGYGPRGKGFITHVDIPDEVENAYNRLLPRFGAYARTVAPNTASRNEY